MRKIVIILAFMITAGTLSAQEQDHNGITVTGEGIVKVKPDRVKIKVSVENEGEEAKPVKEKTDQAIQKVIDFLRAEKLPEKDYQTDYINLNKKYDYNTKEEKYSANQTISITINDIDQYKDIMNGLMKSGINRIDGVTFENSKVEKHQSEARKKAVKNAKEKAEDYAKALGLKVGKAKMIAESSNPTPYPRPVMQSFSAKSADAAGENTADIAVGEIEIPESVTVRFEFK